MRHRRPTLEKKPLILPKLRQPTRIPTQTKHPFYAAKNLRSKPTYAKLRLPTWGSRPPFLPGAVDHLSYLAVDHLSYLAVDHLSYLEVELRGLRHQHETAKV